MASKRGTVGALALSVLLGLLLILASTQITLFVVQPIGALPEGKTLVIPRLENGHFVDSADAMCERKMGGVNLLCRGIALGTVAKESEILLRLPYSETLYLWSTDGKTFDR